MADSILNDTKKILGIDEADTSFDLDIATHINSVLSGLDQIGVGSPGGKYITGSAEEWSFLEVLPNQLALLKTFLFLKVKLLFDPPPTSFAIAAAEKQVQEHEWRLQQSAEELIPPPVRPRTYPLEGEYVLVPLDDVMEGGF